MTKPTSFDIIKWCNNSSNCTKNSPAYVPSNTYGNNSTISARSRYSQLVKHSKYKRVNLTNNSIEPLPMIDIVESRRRLRVFRDFSLLYVKSNNP